MTLYEDMYLFGNELLAQYGLLCEFKDTTSAIQAIESLMTDKDLRERLGEELYNDVRKLTPSHFVNLLFDFLKIENIYQ